MEEYIYEHTAGPLGGNTYTIAEILEDGKAIKVTGVPKVTTLLVKHRDKFDIPSVQTVKWASIYYKKPSGQCYREIATEDAYGDGEGNVIIKILFPIQDSGWHANVISLPKIGAEIIFLPSHKVRWKTSEEMKEVFNDIENTLADNAKILEKIK